MDASETSPRGSRIRRNVIAIGTLLTAAAVDAVSTRPAVAHFGGGGGGGANCFLKGTRILVPGGYRKIEDIQIGDLVMNRSGEAKPVRWVASRRYRKAPGTSWPADVAPVRIMRDA